ncbi:MAG: glycosyltransferase [Nitrospinota bacterium]|nr:glycosyltransferase [Nitrospinota bacterium]
MLIYFSLFQICLIVVAVVYLGVNAPFLLKVEAFSGSLGDSPLISVCVPARNEERDIEACLTSLLSQDYPRFEVIVVDDNSTDRTPEIIKGLQKRFPKLTAIQGASLPSDWYGKPFALHQASQKAQGDLLLFTDADPVFGPKALSTAAYLFQKHQLDMLTLLPGAEFGSFWERTVQPVIFAFIAALTRFRKVNNPKSDAAMGVGAFIMARREVYDRVGGHQSLKQTILEDIGMAHLLKQAGAKIMIADGRNIYSIRMYHSLKEIWIGWRKNVFLAMKKSTFKTFYYIFWILGFLVTPWLVVAVHLWMDSPPMWQGLALAGLAMVWISQATLCYELRLKQRNALLFPLGALVMVAIMINSMIHVLFRGQAEWRGRTYKQPER